MLALLPSEWVKVGSERLRKTSQARGYGISSQRNICHDCRMSTKKSLLDAYRFPGFRPRPHCTGIFGDPKARGIRLVRREKKRRAADVARRTGVSTIVRSGGFATSRAGR